MIYTGKDFIAKKIRNARLKSGLTQEKLAEKIDISTQQVSRIEVGSYIPSLPTFLKIAYVLNIGLDEFGIDDNTNVKDNLPLRDELIKMIYTFNEIELECCYNAIQAQLRNFKLLKQTKMIKNKYFQ